MMPSFASRELYGGAITVELPADSIDASDLRQVPDHQESFLRPDTLSSIIFEINEYQTAQAVRLGSNTPEVEPNIATDSAAASHHFNDLVAEPDYISSPGITTEPIKLPQPSVGSFRAYHSTASIITPEIDLSAKSALPLQWQTNPVQKEYQTKSHQVLLRLEAFETDICIRVNIPMQEFDSAQSEAALTEVALCDQILQRIVQSFEIKDFELFGGQT